MSANPTGRFHRACTGGRHGRRHRQHPEGSGHGVVKEYYIHDVGNQMRTLGRSVYLRYREALGEAIEFPPDHYQGDYIAELAREILSRDGDRHRDRPEEEVLPLFTAYAAGSIMEGIKDDLAAFGVFFDDYSARDGCTRTTGHEAPRTEGNRAMWSGRRHALVSARRPSATRGPFVIRETGTHLCRGGHRYHKNKFDRGFDTVIDVWARPHGYIPR